MSDEKKMCPECGDEMSCHRMEILDRVREFWNCPPCIERRQAAERERTVSSALSRVRRQFGLHHMRREVEMPPRVAEFIASAPGPACGLFIVGECGSGKTQLLCQIARTVSVAVALRNLENSMDQQPDGFFYQSGIAVAPLDVWADRDPGFGGILLIDDVDLLDKERFHADLLHLIDVRQRRELPTIFTSTLPLEQASDVYGIKWRIEAMCGEPIWLPSIDYRTTPR